MRRLAAAALAVLASASLAGCRPTNSTEVGVRTNLFGILEKRGAQEVYSPGGVYTVLPVVNSWTTLSVAQQNLLMNANPAEGDRPIPDDITFKTKDGNNVHIDVNVMWRIDPKKAGFLITNVGQTVEEIRERIVRPISRSVIRDIFNEITSEEYYQVAIKNAMAEKTRKALVASLSPYGILIDSLQVQQHRFDPAYQAAINAQKQAEADQQKLVEQQKSMEVQKRSELEGRRAGWNKLLEDARGEAGRLRNEADGYFQTKTNQAKAVVAVAQAEAEGIRKEAEALGKMGGDAYVKMQVAKQFAQKKFLIVPGSNVSTMNVNELVDYLVGRAASPTGGAVRTGTGADPGAAGAGEEIAKWGNGDRSGGEAGRSTIGGHEDAPCPPVVPRRPLPLGVPVPRLQQGGGPCRGSAAAKPEVALAGAHASQQAARGIERGRRLRHRHGPRDDGRGGLHLPEAEDGRRGDLGRGQRVEGREGPDGHRPEPDADERLREQDAEPDVRRHPLRNACTRRGLCRAGGTRRPRRPRPPGWARPRRRSPPRWPPSTPPRRAARR